MIKKRIRHINRYREIAMALIRHGFGFIVEEIDIFHTLSLPRRLWSAHSAERKTRGERIRGVIQELGPTFIKLGQIASTRPDMMPEEIVWELEKLQDQVAPFSTEEVLEILKQEFRQPLEEIFSSFEEIPVAAASIGQVHIGVLTTGEKVAVKLQRPGITEKVRTDLEILNYLAARAEHRFDWARRYEITKMMAEFGKALLAELDYSKEGKNAELIRKQFKNDSNVYIPAIYTKFSTKKVLTMEYIEGVKLTQLDQLEAHGYSRKRIAERLIHSVFHQIFVEGFFHADPHPGNLIILPGEVLAFMDFGMVGRLTPELKDHFSDLIIALMRESTPGIIKAVMRMGIVHEDVHMTELRRDVEKLREKYYGVPLSQVGLGEAVSDLFDVAFRHHIQIPADLTLLGKTLLTLEGVVEKLDPDISIVNMAEPFGRSLLAQRFHPKRLGERLWNELTDVGDLLLHFPRQVSEMLTTVNKGRARLEIHVPELDQFLKKLDRISNRLAFSIVSLAFSIIMMGLIIGSSFANQQSPMWNLPLIEIGFFVAALMFAWLLFSILKSGRF